MTNQEIFDTVKTHLLTQMEKSAWEADGYSSDSICTVNCAYRGPNGLKCAIGCLIPDEMYSDQLEGKSVASLPTKIIHYIGGDLELIAELQFLHDTIPAEYWETELKRIAKEFNLNFDE